MAATSALRACSGSLRLWGTFPCTHSLCAAKPRLGPCPQVGELAPLHPCSWGPIGPRLILTPASSTSSGLPVCRRCDLSPLAQGELVPQDHSCLCREWALEKTKSGALTAGVCVCDVLRSSWFLQFDMCLKRTSEFLGQMVQKIEQSARLVQNPLTPILSHAPSIFGFSWVFPEAKMLCEDV